MKIILCLFLIAIGIIGLFNEHKRRAKERKEIMKRVVANHIIARDALVKLSTTELMTAGEFLDAIEHLTDNSVEIILKACGTSSYIEEFDWLMKEYDKNKEVKI